MQIIGTKITDIREAAGITQTELATAQKEVREEARSRKG